MLQGLRSLALFPKKKCNIFLIMSFSENVNPYLRFTYDRTKENFGIRAKNPGCYSLADCITLDGRVTACCHDLLGMINLGNAFTTSLEEIFNSQNINK